MVANEYQSMLNTEKDLNMREKEILERAFAMPLTSPAYPPGPYRFVNREYLIIAHRTDPAKLRAVVPEPLELDGREALVKYEFIRMPDSNGFGDYTESGHMFLNDEGPIAGGREPGVFRRNWRNRRCEPRSTRWSERWITGRFASRPVRWDTAP
jgi:acetoacetate decarboxylase